MTLQLSTLSSLLSSAGIALIALAMVAVPSQQVRGDDPVPCTDWCPNEGEICIDGYCQIVLCDTPFCTNNNQFCYWSAKLNDCKCIGDCCYTTLPKCTTCKCKEKPPAGSKDCECR
jgi:hypothetical protein